MLGIRYLRSRPWSSNGTTAHVSTSPILHPRTNSDFRFNKIQHKIVHQCDDRGKPNKNGKWITPCAEDPPCAFCHAKLSKCPKNCAKCTSPCARCGAIRMRLYDFQERGFSDENLYPPIVSMVRSLPSHPLRSLISAMQDDFQKILEHSVSSVAQEELQRFIKWTQDFGQEG